MGREYTVQDIKEKVLIQKIVPALFIALGLGLLGYTAFVGLPGIITGPPLGLTEFIPDTDYQPATVMFKIQTNTDPQIIARQAVAERQTVYRHKQTKKIASQFNPEVISRPDQYDREKLQLSVKAVRRIVPEIHMTDRVKEKIRLRTGLKEDPEEKLKSSGFDRLYEMTVDQNEADVLALAVRLKNIRGVESAGPNLLVHTTAAIRMVEGGTLPAVSGATLTPNDPFYSGIGHIIGTNYLPTLHDQWGLETVKATEAWNTALPYSTGGRDTLIAVLDTGLDVNHEDIKGQVWVNPQEDLNGNGCADYWSMNITDYDCRQPAQLVNGDLNGNGDGDNYVDDLNGFDFWYSLNNFNNNPNGISDPEGHGTMVAGIAAARTNNGTGMSGVCWSCRIIPIRVFNDHGQSNIAETVEGLAYAITMGADVINMSYGSSRYDNRVEYYIDRANEMGAVMVAAIGNDKTDVTYGQYPANLNNVIAVGSVNENGLRSYSYSNFGYTLDLMAPGDPILSLRAANTDLNNNPTQIISNQYYWASGTSFAAPYVSGIAGLMRSLNPNVTNTEIERILKNTAQDMTEFMDERGTILSGQTGWDVYTGNGLVDAARAVKAVADIRPDLTVEPGSVAGLVWSDGMAHIQGTISNIGYQASNTTRISASYMAEGSVINSFMITDIPPAYSHQFDFYLGLVPANTWITLAVDSDNFVSELREDNNSVSVPLQSNQPPDFTIPANRVATEYQPYNFNLTNNDPNIGQPVHYLCNWSGGSCGTQTEPNSIGMTFDPSGLFYWLPGEVTPSSQTYTLTFTATDGDVPLDVTKTVTIAVNNGTPPPFMTIITGQGFARSWPEGRMITHWDAPDSGYCYTLAPFGLGTSPTLPDSDRCGLTYSDWYSWSRYNIPLNVVKYIRIKFRAGDSDWNVVPPLNTRVDDNTIVRRVGDQYIFDLYPAIGTDSDFGGSYFSTTRWAEQDDEGDNWGTANYNDWPRTWKQWEWECVKGASGSNNFKNGFGARVWSSGTAFSSYLTHISFCIFDDSNGDISPSWSVEVHRNDGLWEQTPVMAPIGNKVVQEKETVSFWVPATDFNTDFLTYSATGLPAGATLDPNTGQFSWTPSFTQSGTYNITFTANDGLANSNSQTMSITVNNVDQVPVLASIGPKTVALCGLLTFQLSVLNLDEDPLTYSIQGSPAPSAFNPATGRYTFACACGTGIYSPYYDVIFRVTDSHGKTDAETVRITIQGVPPSPGGGGGASRCEPNCDYRDYMPSYKRSVE